MKAIFLTSQPYDLNRVYNSDIINRIKSSVEFSGDLYSVEDLKASPERFAKTEYIFSTWGMPALNEEEIKSLLPSLKCVFYAAGSVQSFARPFLNCGVKVFSAWAANAVPVAEYALSQIILANKGYFKCSNAKSYEEHRAAFETFMSFKGNYGTKVGIIGAGMIGTLLIKMLKAYRLDILVFDPFMPDEKAAALGVEKVDLERLFSECNVVSNHLANNEQTKGMLNKSLFSLMPKFATFINTGRGAQVVEPDLADVLQSRNDLTAILDVTFPEPPEPNHIFYKLENCILTPHIAGSSGNEVGRMAEYMVNEFENYISNKPYNYEVTLKMLETMA